MAEPRVPYPEDPGAERVDVGGLLSRLAQGALGAARAIPTPFDPGIDPALAAALDTGLMGGIVRGTTPAAEGLVNFVRRVWPSLGRAADRLPWDIDVEYMARRNPDFAGHFSRPSASTPSTIRIAYAPGQQDPNTATHALGTYLHELLHALYLHKSAARMASRYRSISGSPSRPGDIGPLVDPGDYYLAMPYSKATPRHGERIWRKLGPEMQELRRGYFNATDQPSHGALDRMATRIMERRLPKEFVDRMAEGMR